MTQGTLVFTLAFLTLLAAIGLSIYSFSRTRRKLERRREGDGSHTGEQRINQSNDP